MRSPSRTARPSPLRLASSAFIAAVVAYRSKKVHTFVVEVCVELSKVTWPTRKETWSQTIVVLIVSVIAAVILGVYDAVWSHITDLIYNV